MQCIYIIILDIILSRLEHYYSPLPLINVFICNYRTAVLQRTCIYISSTFMYPYLMFKNKGTRCSYEHVISCVYIFNHIYLYVYIYVTSHVRIQEKQIARLVYHCRLLHDHFIHFYSLYLPHIYHIGP